MTTRFVGTKNFSQFLTKVASKSKKRNERLILLHRNEPVFELRPLSKKEISEQKLMVLIQEANDDVKAGRVYSLEEVRKRLGL